jgi:CubicO group peptidase (beta-lactamase class C family)
VRRAWPLLLALLQISSSRAADVADLQQLYDGAMLPDLEVRTLSHTEDLLPVRVVRRAGTVRPLPRRAGAFPTIRYEDHGRRVDLYDYLATNRVAGILVIKDGATAFEDYELGAGPDTRWASFSMAKSVASTLVGAALADGFISSLDDTVGRYVPALRGGVYDAVTIRQLLTMSSGVRWNEAYIDPLSDRRQVLKLQIARDPAAILRYMSGLPRAAPAGSTWHYNTGETYVLGAVIAGATHRPLADYLSAKIWSRAGMEHDATWWLDGPGGLGGGGQRFGGDVARLWSLWPDRRRLGSTRGAGDRARRLVRRGRRRARHRRQDRRLWLHVVDPAADEFLADRRLRGGGHLRAISVHQSTRTFGHRRLERALQTRRRITRHAR